MDEMSSRRIPRTLLVFAALGGLAALIVTWRGSLTLGIAAGVLTWAVGLATIWWSARNGLVSDHDASRRRFIAAAGLGGLAWVAGGAAVGRTASKLARPDARAVQDAAAADLGADYMELIRRAYHPGRSGDLQLVVAPFNSANYANESLTLLPNDPRTSHAAPWMYLERIPLVVYGPGIVSPSTSEERVSLADLAPTTASLIGYDAWPGDRDGRVLPGLTTSGAAPKIVVTFVIDGGGWNVLQEWPRDWPNLKRLMREGADYPDAIMGSFPAVTACAHATIGTGAFPRTHGITGHNIRDGEQVRKAFGSPGLATGDDIKVPTLADLWHDATGAWVGEIGYQVWHLGMLGNGGIERPEDDVPVGVYFDENGGTGWQPHHPTRYRLPARVPGLDRFEARLAAFDDPGWDEEYARWANRFCCSPPIAGYQGDLIEATLDAEPIGGSGPSLLYTTYKSPDYTGHIYGMSSEWEGLMLRAVDEDLGRVVEMLEARYPGEYVLIVTADHGQCPLPDAMGGVRLDPIQLERIIEERFGAGLGTAVQSVVPSEIYLDDRALRDAGASREDVAAFLRRLTYRQNLGPYVPRDAVQQALLDKEQFSAVFATTYLDDLGDVGRFGPGNYDDAEVDPGVPPASLLQD
jgi:arylsulfatase A-like enzyme